MGEHVVVISSTVVTTIPCCCNEQLASCSSCLWSAQTRHVPIALVRTSIREAPGSLAVSLLGCPVIIYAYTMSSALASVQCHAR